METANLSSSNQASVGQLGSSNSGVIEQLMAIRDRVALFGGLTEKQLVSLCSRLQRQQFRAGETVFRQGDFSSHIHIVVDGAIRLVFEVDEHPLLKVDLGVGDCFGETSVIGIQSHSASAVAAEDTALVVISKAALMQIFEEDKELFAQLVLNIARETCRRLHQTDEMLLQQLHRQAFGVVQLPLPGLMAGSDLLPHSLN